MIFSFRRAKRLKAVVSRGKGGRWYWKLIRYVNGKTVTAAICDGSFPTRIAAQEDLRDHFDPYAKVEL